MADGTGEPPAKKPTKEGAVKSPAVKPLKSAAAAAKAAATPQYYGAGGMMRAANDRDH
jgi:hypothetical protein